MPELPEVETIRQQLAKKIVDHRIEDVTCDTIKMLRPSPKEFRRRVVGRMVKKVNRRAKLLFIVLDNSQVVVSHMKLNGRLFWRDVDDSPDDYIHVTLLFSGGKELRFADSRKFGFMEVVSAKKAQDLFDKFGPEPLDDLDLSDFRSVLKATRRKVKDVLMDQSKISGIGNIYANDALWLARIHPETPATDISTIKQKRLFEAINDVLTEAVDLGGASDSWFLHTDGSKGKYQTRFKVYQRQGKACSRHPDKTIKYMKVSQRGTFICSQCQKM